MRPDAPFGEETAAPRRALGAMVAAALEAVDPAAAARLGAVRIDTAGVARARLVGFGKAALPMARAAAEALGVGIERGLVVAPRGYADPAGSQGAFEVALASHPLPDASGAEAARRVAALADELEEDDLLVAVVSGGGSALLPLPAEGISLEDLVAVTSALIAGGARIEELNAVRKHLSAIQGGQLARLAHPARTEALVLSDVVGDPLDAIASGPTAPDPTTFAGALVALERYGLLSGAPRAVIERLERGAAGRIPETPQPGDPIFERVRNRVVGGGVVAARAAVEEARRRGYRAEIETRSMTGEAREVGRRAGALARVLAGENRPACRVLAGETTVTVRGGGRGGRNQELALAAALEIEGLEGALVAALGTDGVDGPTDAAGAAVDGGTAGRIRAAGLDPEALLADNDSHRALKASGDLLVSGPTGTNAADLLFVIAGEDPV